MSRIRITTGIVLFAFVFGHLLNLSAGLVSIDAMEAARPILMGPWSNPVGGLVLLTAFLTHAALGLWTLYRRNSLAMNWRDGGQALLGVAIIPLLLPHVVAVAVGPALTGMEPSFTWVLAAYWLFVPWLGIQQVLALIAIWAHGCYGLLLWLQVQERLGAAMGLIWPLVVAVPMTALLGFVEAGKTIFAHRADPEFMAPVHQAAALIEPVGAQLSKIHDTILWVYLSILALTLAARLLRLRRRAGEVTVDYGGTVIRERAGLSLWELARASNLPHAGLCGARGRCGSCAVRVLAGLGDLPPPSALEAEALERTCAGDAVRLACQIVPSGGEISVEPVYDAWILPGEYRTAIRARRAGRDRHSPPDGEAGSEQVDPDGVDRLTARAGARADGARA